jgi:SAM-dependent methyltransferase
MPMAPFDPITAIYTPAHAWMYERVISYGSIKHWSSREAGLAECMRVLKPGGPLLIADADRSTSFEDAEKFVANHKIPRCPGSINLAIFHTWIAGRSIDLAEARDLARGLDLVDENVSRIAEMPLVMIAGRRSARAQGPGDHDGL